MATSTRSKAPRRKVRAHQERLRRHGLVWVPDVRSPAFVSEAHRQSLAVAESQFAQEDQALIDAVSDLPVR